MQSTESIPDTILDVLRSHAAAQPGETASTFLVHGEERATISYAELDQRAQQIAHGLLQHAEPGDRAVMMYSAGLGFIEALLGCLYAGIVDVPAYPPKNNRNVGRVLGIAESCSPRLLLCSSEISGSVESGLAGMADRASLVVTDELNPSASGALPERNSDGLAFLQYTSGSTAAPRGVMVTHGNIVANELLIRKCFQFTRESLVFSWLPMFHDMGLIGGVLAPLFTGFPPVLMSPTSFLREPVLSLRAVTEFRATCTGAPNFAYDLCTRPVDLVGPVPFGQQHLMQLLQDVG